MTPAFPLKNVLNLVLAALLVWLALGDGAGILPVVAAPGQISVLIVDETEDYAKPEYKPYLDVLNSSLIIAYLNGHCAKVGNTPEWRHWDKDTDVTNESAKWQAAMAVPRASLPWIAISNGSRGFAGPLPASVDDTMALLQHWGGP